MVAVLKYLRSNIVADLEVRHSRGEAWQGSMQLPEQFVTFTGRFVRRLGTNPAYSLAKLQPGPLTLGRTSPARPAIGDASFKNFARNFVYLGFTR